MPDAFFASRSHTPREVAWLAASHEEKARGSAKARVGSSPPGTSAAAAGFAAAFFVDGWLPGEFVLSVLFVVRMVSLRDADSGAPAGADALEW